MPERKPPQECANCGADIPRTARACPGCGADEGTGWREADTYDGLDLPDDAYETGASPARKRVPARTINGVAWYWWCIGVVLIVLLVLGAIVLRW